jgi:hypothetical protein
MDYGMQANNVQGRAAGDARDMAMSQVKCEQRQAEIPSEFERLERTLKGCLQGVENLAERLQASVMRSEPPSPIGNAACSTPTATPQTPYGSRLQELTSTAAIINARIQSLNARLEV